MNRNGWPVLRLWNADVLKDRLAALEQFQEKWKPVLRPELRKNKEIEHFRDSEKSGKALELIVAALDGRLAQKTVAVDVKYLPAHNRQGSCP